jgi:hypothetical protein
MLAEEVDEVGRQEHRPRSVALRSADRTAVLRRLARQVPVRIPVIFLGRPNLWFLVIGLATLVGSGGYLSGASNARAEEVPSVTSFSASPTTVQVGKSVTITATMGPENGDYELVIVNKRTGKELIGCRAWWPSCWTEVHVPWSEQAEPKDLEYEAEIIKRGGTSGGGGTSLTVPVEPVVWHMYFTADKNPGTVGETVTVHLKGLEPSLRYTGYEARVTDGVTGEPLFDCVEDCYRTISLPYSLEANPEPFNYRAEIVSNEEPLDVQGTAEYALLVNPIRFQASMSFSEPTPGPGGTTHWTATLSASPPLWAPPFYIGLWNLAGEYEGGCALYVACGHQVGPGTYRTVVEDEEGEILAATQWWTIPGNSEEPEEDTADDLNLLALAGLFSGPSAICDAVLFYPGTHFAESTLSDQYLACEAAVANSASAVQVLRAIAAAGGGTAALWWLYEKETETQTPPGATETPEESEPLPVPPIGWPNEINSEVLTLMSQNPELETEREARIVIKQCQRLMSRAGLSSNKCTELPIFASGDSDVPQATKHDLEALLYHPPWVRLNYEDPALKPKSTWYQSLPACSERSEELKLDCDEFPFFSTVQGGGEAKPRPSLKVIDSTQNRRQGGKLRAFYNTCNISNGISQPFLNVPMPLGSEVPTLYLCNGA